jgi:predicted neuraminidase
MSDLALHPPRVIVNPGPEYASTARRWQGIPGIERAANGRLWATWYTGGPGEGPGNHVPLVTSADDGRTWSEPVLVVDPGEPCRAYDPCLWHDPLGRLWLFWAQSEGYFDGRTGVWAIRANEATAAAPAFGPPRRLCHGVMMNKPTVLSTGEWLLPAAVWRYAKSPVSRPELDAERYSNVVVSTDAGATWTRRGGADVPDRAFDEHMIVERRDGSLWMLVRTTKGIGESISRDRGHTWHDARPDALPGPCSRFFVRRLHSGRLLLVNHDMAAARAAAEAAGGPVRRSHLTAWLSDDDGATWRGGLLLDERAGVSYPDGLEADDGRLYVIYDFNRGDQHALGRDREILMAVFTEPDVLAARPVSPHVCLGMLVSRATGSSRT